LGQEKILLQFADYMTRAKFRLRARSDLCDRISLRSRGINITNISEIYIKL